MTPKEKRIRLSMRIIPFLGVLISLVTGYAFYYSSYNIHHNEFDKYAMERSEAIHNGIRMYMNVVQDLSGFLSAFHHVSRDQFRTYVRPILVRQRGFHAISWNVRVTGEQRKAFEEVNARELPGFGIMERSPENQMVPAGERDEYIVVRYLEPLVGNEKALGYDVASDPVRLQTFILAQNSGHIVVSPRLVLVQEEGQQFSVLIVHAVDESEGVADGIEEGRHQSVQGFAVGVLRLGEMVESAIAGLSPRGIDFYLHDVTLPERELLLYHHRSRMGSVEEQSRIWPDDGMLMVNDIVVANRRWRFKAFYHGYYSSGMPHLYIGAAVSLVGLVITVLVFISLRTLEKEEKDRLAMEDFLRKNEEQKRTIIESSPFSIIVIDGEDIVQYFNVASEQLFGYSRHEIIGRELEMIVPNDLKKAHKTGFHRYHKGGKEHIIGQPPFETEALRKTGEIFPIRLAVNKMVMGVGVSFIGVVIDITEEKKLLSELIQAEKMAGLGNMVAGVAHELNTPVGIGVTASSELADRIQSFATLLREEGISKEELEEHVGCTSRLAELVRHNLERSADLVRSFKLVAVDLSEDMLQEFKVRPCLESTVMALHHELEAVRLATVIECSEDIEIYSNPGALARVVLNLVNNSCVHGYSPPSRGRIVMRCTIVDGLFTLVYNDDGMGMSEEVRRRIFEPFFTTRRHAGGTGLGMHIVYNLVTKTLGGSITCHSSLGEGAQFVIVIPGNKQAENRSIPSS
ncbi:MAG: CHASE domain-containing protein [Magnetococcales bacterium]|nr:CHASE domain-containing protein [Magnetococcales bacterium]